MKGKMIKAGIVGLVVGVILTAVVSIAIFESSGDTYRRRNDYYATAIRYERQADEQQSLADAFWTVYSETSPNSSSANVREWLVTQIKRYDDMAKHYRQLALGYSELAAK